uniref:Uncharacterized protein n=1 Tax=Trypanosoma vivax (strain Y486) TaxID=1055687 RepID=G0TYM5_TRYVY|nr:conserved hypothetical protein [Trypanosoma vivax Y486]
MVLPHDDLDALTLRSPFVYEYGDAPHFMHSVNNAPVCFFARYRSNKDDSNEHRWSRVLEVIPRSVGVHGKVHADGVKDSLTVVPLKWNKKQFFIAFRIEGEEKCVELPRLSKVLPTEDEVLAYCARAAEGQLYNSAMESDKDKRTSELAHLSPRQMLPNAVEIQHLRAYRLSAIVNRRWTPEDIALAREQNERMGRVGASAAPVRLTVTSMHNMLLESQLDIASSSRAVGHVAAAMERRNSVRFSQCSTSSPMTPTGVSPAVGSTQTLSSATQLSGEANVMCSAAAKSTDVSSGVTLADLTSGMHPALSSEVIQESLRRWEESKRDEDRFYAYVSDKDRSAYMKKISRITQQNYEKNKRDRLFGIANEQRLDRKGNLMESRGLWIVDDDLRSQLAKKYKEELDDETAAGATSAAVGKKKADNSSNTEASGSGDVGGTLLPVSEEEAMVERYRKHQQKQQPQDVYIDLVTEEFLNHRGVGSDASVIVPCDSDNPNTNLLADNVTPLVPPAKSPEMLLTGSSSRMITSQLLHRAVCRLALKRLSSVAESHSEAVEKVPDEGVVVCERKKG